MTKLNFSRITNILNTAIIALLLLSCGKAKQGDLLEIPIDIRQNNSLPLSEIAEEITAIDLELTDESMINPMHHYRIILSENKVFIATLNKILVFDKTGKFIQTIGSQGQGPQEYTYIHELAIDETNKRLFISTANRKIISYDFNGNFLKEKLLPKFFINDMNYVDNALFILVDNTKSDSTGVYSRSALYQLNDEMQIVDSCRIRDLNFNESSQISIIASNYLLKGNKSFFLYYGDVFIRDNKLSKRILRDTLYRVDNNALIPELKLKFENEDVGKCIHLTSIYRSSRYVFAKFTDYCEKPIKEYSFCYDTKIKKGYNLQNKYTDDVNQIEDPVDISPFNSDTEMFYYLYTNMKPDDSEEPNPTLYIGRLKK